MGGMEKTEDIIPVEAGYGLMQVAVLLLVVVGFCGLYFRYRRRSSSTSEKSVA